MSRAAVLRTRALALATVLLGAVLLHPRLAVAQCGAPTSSCRYCHEVEGQARPFADEPWHADHAFGDFCADCHGGVRTASDQAQAHEGLSDPLALDHSPCVACHEDSAKRLDRYNAAHGTRAVAPPPDDRSEPPRDRPRADRVTRVRSTAVLSSMLLALVVMGGAYIVRNERRVRTSVEGRLLPRAKDAEWSPYFAGTLLGVVAAVSMVVFGHRLSGGGAYQQIAAPLGRILSPASTYWNRVVAGGATWELAGLVGAIVGAFAAARSSGTFRVRTMPDSQWSEVFGASVVTRWLVGFCGAALTEFASGIAGGCTASLAVSGGAALSPAAFLFMAGMFVGGIPAAALAYRKVTR